MVGTSSWNQTVHQKKIPFKSDEHPIRSPFLLVIYTVYIYTYTLCNPILNNSLCNPIQIPVSTTVKTTTKPSFSQVFLWVFPLFCWFFPHSKCHPRPAFIPRGAASLRPGTAVCGPRWGSGWVLDGSMGFHQQLNGDFLWNVSPETNGDLDGM